MIGYLLVGLILGYGVRLFYFLFTGKDIPLLKPKYEKERLKQLIKDLSTAYPQ